MRKCNLCAYKAPEGCIAWECEYINRIEAIDAYKATRWISVTERLPETDDMVLVTCRTKKGIDSVNPEDRRYKNHKWCGLHKRSTKKDGFCHWFLERSGEYDKN